MAGSAEKLSGAYLRRDPGSGVLYEILSTHLETFLATGADDRLEVRVRGIRNGFARF